jgi:hypothetical protein
MAMGTVVTPWTQVTSTTAVRVYVMLLIESVPLGTMAPTRQVEALKFTVQAKAPGALSHGKQSGGTSRSHTVVVAVMVWVHEA